MKELNRKVATKVTQRDGFVSVQYHATVVAELDGSVLTLRNGGWQSATTKSRINEFCDKMGLPVSVFQKDWTWYVKAYGEAIEFEEGMELEVEL